MLLIRIRPIRFLKKWTYRYKREYTVPYPDNYSTAGIGESFGYVRRSEQHGIAAHDWMWMIDFADREFGIRR